MKVKKGFLLKEISEQWILVPTDEFDPDTVKIITLSSTAALLWRELEKGVSDIEDLAKALLSEYDIDYRMAYKDSKEFIEELKALDMLE